MVVLLTTECADPTETHIGSITKNAPPDPIPAPTAVSRALPAELIYITDPSGGDLVSNIVARDPVTGNTVRTYRVRYTPSIAFSPDGNTMFVTDSYRSRVTRGNMNGYISSFDIRTGSLLSDDVPLTERTRYKFYPIGIRCFLLLMTGTFCSPTNTENKMPAISEFPCSTRVLLRSLTSRKFQSAAGESQPRQMNGCA